MPKPGNPSPARHEVQVTDHAWARIYLPLVGAVQTLVGRANALQFLTIRRYLGLVFGTLVVLLVGLAIWN